MARPERNDIDYFPHSVNHGKKMFYLRDKFGNDGYAVWFMLLEHLGKANYHYLDLKDDVESMYLSSEFKVTESVLYEIIESLVKFGDFDAELWNDERLLFNTKFIDNISDAYSKRKNICIDKKALLLLLPSLGRSLPSLGGSLPSKCTLIDPVNPQRIVKDSKGKKSKEEKHPVKSIDFDALLAYINKAFGREFRIVNSKVKASYNAVMKEGYTKEDIMTAIDNAATDNLHILAKYKHCTVEYFSRAKTLDLHSVTTKSTSAMKQTVNSPEDYKNLYQ